MSTVWRFTGPPENWITGIGVGKWTLNEGNKSLWERDIHPGDVALFHSTRKSDFSDKATSCVVGFGYVGDGMTRKKDGWWVQEVASSQNLWPYVIPLTEIYLFSNAEKIDFETPVDRKPPVTVKKEIELLIANGIQVSDLNDQAKSIDPTCPQFPVNGSASRVNRIFEELILGENQEFFIPRRAQTTELVEARLAEGIDEQLSKLSKAAILEAARAFDNSAAPSHSEAVGPRKIRKENQVQKRRIAALEDFTCQVCGFHYEYTTKRGKKAWIIHVDHIFEKAGGGSENIRNLWVLCPNCHAKKTCGAITVDLPAGTVMEGGVKIKLFCDSHLFV